MENKDLIIIALIVAMIYLYYQNRKLTQLPATTQTVFVAGENDKDQEIEKLKDEKSKVEIALNAKLTELKQKYSKQGQLLDEEQLENNKLVEKIESLESKITELETERNNLLTEINKHDDLDKFQNWLNEKEENQANLPDWNQILGEIKDKISDYHLSESNWASGLLTRNTKYWRVFKNWIDNNHD